MKKEKMKEKGKEKMDHSKHAMNDMKMTENNYNSNELSDT
jgi:hypothetical protein